MWHAQVETGVGVATIHNLVIPQPGKLQFDASAYQTSESDGKATIRVVRVGGTDGTISVNYATADGTAISGEAYTAVSGLLIVGPGQAVVSFTVPVRDLGIVGGAQTVLLSLKGASLL